MKKNRLRLRKANEDDALLLFQWVNNAEVRNASRVPRPISWEEHLAWLGRKLQDRECYFFIGMDAQNRPIGQVRLDSNPKGDMEINVSIQSGYRGCGYGSRLIDMAVKRVFRVKPEATVHAYIKNENKRSLRAFARADFKLLEIKEEQGIKLAHYVRINPNEI